MNKLLLADDEAYVTTVLSMKVGPSFDEVLTAGDGDEAFELAVRHLPSLVISDYQMPGTDGYQLACRLRDDPRTSRIPVILLTARGHLLTEEQLGRTNIRRMLAKPFSVKQVSAVVAEVLAKDAAGGSCDGVKEAV